MAFSINHHTKVITIPKADLTLLQLTPTEVRELNIPNFHTELRDWEDGPDGMPMPTTHNYYPPITVGGVALAPVIEMINGYSITFEDGLYSVNLVGANSNIADFVNRNQVSVRTANSAGLLQSREIEYNTFAGGVTIDVVRGVNGTEYPRGTPMLPVNNVSDARLIAETRGFKTLFVVGDITFGVGDDISGFLIIGQNAARSMIILQPEAICVGTEFRETVLTGTLDGSSIIRQCFAFDLEYVSGFLFQTALAGYINLGGSTTAQIFDCYADTNSVTIDVGGTGRNLNVQRFGGDIVIRNKTGVDKCEVYLTSGEITIDPTVTEGTGLELSGVGHVHNLSSVTPESDHVISGDTLRVVEAILRNKTVTDPTSGTMVVYETDGTTPKLIANLYEDAAGTTPYQGNGAERRERLQ